MINGGLELCMRCMSRLGPDGRCVVCGSSNENLRFDGSHIVPGTLLGLRYVVGTAMLTDAEGVQYIGYDTNEKYKVTIKEYFPRELAFRDEYDMSVSPKKGREAAFKALLTDFYELYSALRALPETDGVIPVLDVFRENSTVYAVSKYIASISFEEALAGNGGELTWSQVKKLFMPVLENLSALHMKGIVHRGVSPETLLVDPSGAINVSGFAIASARTGQSATGALLYSGYSAPEQYSADGCQGSWTDVYSICAVMYRALTGTRPPEADERKIQDNLVPAAELNPGVPQNVSEAVFEGMLIYPRSRLQTIDELISRLLSETGSHTAVFVAQDKNKPASGRESSAGARSGVLPARRGMPYGVLACLITMIVLLLIGGGFLYAQYEKLQREKGVTISELSNVDIDALADTIRKVPDFKGQYIETVKANESYAEVFKFEYIDDYNDNYPEGIIYDQSIEKDTKLEEGRKMSITLYVSKGSQYEEMPDLVGSKLEYAMKVLDEKGIYYKVMGIASEDGEPGFVLRTNKEEGDKIDTKVDVVILFVLDESASEQSSGISGGITGGVSGDAE